MPSQQYRRLLDGSTPLISPRASLPDYGPIGPPRPQQHCPTTSTLSESTRYSFSTWDGSESDHHPPTKRLPFHIRLPFELSSRFSYPWNIDPRGPDDYAREREQLARQKWLWGIEHPWMPLSSILTPSPPLASSSTSSDENNKLNRNTPNSSSSSSAPPPAPNVGILHTATDTSSSSNGNNGPTAHTPTSTPSSSSASSKSLRERQLARLAAMDAEAAEAAQKQKLKEVWMHKPQKAIVRAQAQWVKWSRSKRTEEERGEAMKMAALLQEVIEEKLMMKKSGLGG
ncbi:MAG: hypothetical protein Q9201_003448 [Fulgogasparrea decipioides]